MAITDKQLAETYFNEVMGMNYNLKVKTLLSDTHLMSWLDVLHASDENKVVICEVIALNYDFVVSTVNKEERQND